MSDHANERPNKLKKPTQIDSLTPDQMVAAVLRLAMEVSVLRDQLKTQEQLLIQNNVINAQSINEFVPDKEDAAARGQERMRLIEGLIDDLSGA